jgi:sucrose phosphorylase
MIRLDAIAFLWKESGTTSLHLPQTHTVIKLYRQILEIAAPHIKIITETNVPHEENISYFGSGNDEAHMVYNFALPPLSADALLTGDARVLTGWARSLELPGQNTYFYNFTASHDGIGLLPAHNILAMDRIQGLIDKTEESGGRVGYKNNADGTKTAYELNISLFDLLSDPGPEEGLEVSIKRFTASQAIALSLSGVPALYYHSIIGSRNYNEGVEITGSNRTINREKVYIENVIKELETNDSTRNLVFQRLESMIEARRNLRAFHPQGKQNVLSLSPEIFSLERISPEGDKTVLSLINVSGKRISISLDHSGKRDILSGRVFSSEISLAPYEVLWLK